MGKGSLFWAMILILAGILLLLNNFGIIHANVWELIWPLFLIALGVWVLWAVFAGRRPVEAEEVTIPLEGAARARVRVKHGAGRLRVDASAGAGDLVSGTFGGGLEQRARRDGDTLVVEMRLPSHVFPAFGFPWTWGPGSTLDWTFGLSGEVPLSLELETGASDIRLDLTDLRVTDLRLQTGASSTDVTLPANAGHTRARISAGAASVVVRVPSGVAARVRASGALGSVNVDRERFPREGSVYRSADYDAAPNKVDLEIETGVGSIRVR